GAREAVHPSTDEVPQGVAAERETGEQYYVGEHDERTDTDAETVSRLRPARSINARPEEECLNRVPGEHDEEEEREIQSIAMDVLEQERPVVLAPVRFSRLADRTGGRVLPEGAVVRLAVVVAGQAKDARKCQDQKAGGKWCPVGKAELLFQ